MPTDGAQVTRRWLDELTNAGFTTPAVDPGAGIISDAGTPLGQVDRDGVVDLVLLRLGGRRSAWNAADIRGEVEKHLPTLGLILEPAIRRELAEGLTARAHAACVPLLDRDDVPGHVRHLTSTRVLGVEADIVDRLAARAERGGYSVPPTSPDFDRVLGSVQPRTVGNTRNGGNPLHVLDAQQLAVSGALAGTHRLLVVEGAAGAGKTTTLAAAKTLIQAQHQRLVVVTPTLKAAQVAGKELGTDAFSAAWLIHQHGYRWNNDHHWTRIPADPAPAARLRVGDMLLVDEAGMLDQDTARALLTIADEAHAFVALVGDRHQLPAVGRGGVLDLAARWVPPTAHLHLDTVHRFTDPDYAALSLQMRTGERAADVFDSLLARGDIVIHRSDVERLHHLAALTTPGDGNALVIADTRDQVRALNAAIRDTRRTSPTTSPTDPIEVYSTRAGEQIGTGDAVTTRRNDRDLGVTNRDRWTVTAVDPDSVTVTGRAGTRTLPTAYARKHVELAYATTVHGAQGETVDTAHFLLGDTTGAASAYVAMTRGRHHNTAHLVADTIDDARNQWTHTFTQDRADLGPTHATHRAAADLDRYGPLSIASKNRPELTDTRQKPATSLHR